MKKIAVLLNTLITYAVANISDSSTETKLVIYNNNQSLVEENRPYTIDKDVTEVIFPKVANSIITDSIITDFQNKRLKILSQNYRNNIFSEGMLLRKNIGKEVEFITNPSFDSVKEFTGTLLSVSPNVIKDSKTSKIYLGVPSKNIIVSYIPKDVTVYPELVWKIKPLKTSIKGSVKNIYLLNQLKWISNYNIKIDKNDKLNLQGWIKITNNSGRTFKDTEIKLLAGNVHKENHNMYDDRRMLKSVMDNSMMDSPESVEATAIEGYQLYTIPFLVSLKNKEETLVSFIDKRDVNYTREYSLRGTNPMYSINNDRKIRATQSIILTKTEIPLPQGHVRIYKETDHNFILVGEPYLKNTGKNEKVRLKMGENFNLLLKEKVLSRTNSRKNNDYYSEVEYYIKSSDNRDLNVTVLIPTINNNRNVTITSSEKYLSKNANEITFNLSLKSNSTKKWKVKYEYFR